MKKIVTLSAALASALAAAAHAQTPPATPQADSTELAEVLVTASRREQSLQKTAIAVTALSADELQARGISNVVELTKFAPAVKIGQNAGSGVQITVRGVGNFGGNSFAEPGVAVNLDGVYLARAPASTGVFYDVERVEILKGPQGTLYGRNSTGGVVNVITRKPGRQFGGEAEVEFGNYNLFRAAAALNLPVSDTLSLRFAGQRVKHDGYLSDGYNDADDLSGRARLLYTPNDALSILLQADFTQTDGKGNNGVWAPYIVAGDPYVGPSDPRSNAVFTNAPLPPPVKAALPRFTDAGYLDNRARGFSATIDYDLGFATGTLIAADRNSEAHYLHYSAGFPVTDDNRDDPSEWRTAELRLASKADGRLDWILGGFYYDDFLHTRISPDQGTTYAQPDITVDTTSWSGFGEATFALTDSARVTAGGRYTSDDKQISGTQLAPILAPPVAYPAVCPAALGAVVVPGPLSNPSGTASFAAACRAPVAGKASFSKFTWKLGAEFDLAPQSLLYANVGTGFKGGGFYASLNTAAADAFPNNAYRPETLTAYTLGSKNRFYENRLQINAEAFYWDYKDKQVPHIGIVQPGNNINLIVENAAAAKVYGAELEVQWQASAHDLVSADVQWLHANYENFQYNVVVPAFASNPGAVPATGCSFSPVVAINGPGTPGVSRVNCSDREIPFAPRTVLNLAYRHTFGLGGYGSLVAGAATHIESAFQVGEEYLPGQRQGSSTVSDADVTWRSLSERYSVAAYVQNIEDEAVAQTGFVQPTLGRALNILRAPRTYGLRASARF